MSSEYTSHYDAKANICYIMVHEAFISDDGNGDKTFSYTYLVYDAFEGRAYASYMCLGGQPTMPLW